MNTSKRSATLQLAMLVGVLFILSSCSYFVNDLRQLAPVPNNVTVKKPPEITDATPSFIIVNKTDNNEDYYYWYCQRYWPYRCGYVRASRWMSTVVDGNLSIMIDISDPSLDLNDKPTRIYIRGSEPASAGSAGSNVCELNINERDIALNPTDITGKQKIKVVKITLRNVHMTFTSKCMTFAADLPLRLIVDDEGVEVVSPTEGLVTVVVKKP